jgi:hypothetical protein
VRCALGAQCEEREAANHRGQEEGQGPPGERARNRRIERHAVVVQYLRHGRFDKAKPAGQQRYHRDNRRSHVGDQHDAHVDVDANRDEGKAQANGIGHPRAQRE